MSLPLWEECAWKNIPSPVSAAENESSDLDTPCQIFGIDEEINKKIFLYLGNGYKVPGNAIVVGQNEQLTDRGEDIGAIFALGGPSFEEEVQLAAPIQTGDSCITKAGNLPYDYVIHSVAPRYDEKYLTASEHALFSAYKSSLLLAVERGVQDLILTCIYTKRKRYPRDEAAHIALRVIRKFLQHSELTSKLKRIMFCVPTQEDYEIYAALMIAYFPRSNLELQYQEGLLPPELGDEWGEVKRFERELKVSAGPRPLTEEELAEYRITTASFPSPVPSSSGGNLESFGSPPARRTSHSTGPMDEATLGRTGGQVKSMQDLEGDDYRDEKRRVQVAKALQNMTRQQKMELRFRRLAEDLAHEVTEVEETNDEKALESYYKAWSAIESMQLIEFIGKDKLDRTVVLVCADRLRFPANSHKRSTAAPARAPVATNEDDPYDYFANASANSILNKRVFEIDLERITLFFLKVLETLACRPFVLVYSYSNVTDESKEPDPRIAEVFFDLLDARYRMNLQKFYILHASFYIRMSAWATMPFANLSIWKEVRWAKRMEDMTKYIDLERQNWPPEIIRTEESLDA
jgi:O-acetyl-ADP-ribose deacetylase (regulator of RNase III)